MSKSNVNDKVLKTSKYFKYGEAWERVLLDMDKKVKESRENLAKMQKCRASFLALAKGGTEWPV